MFVFQTGSRPRNPLLRLVGSILGLFVVLGVIALGFFAFVALLAGGALWLLIRAFRGQPGSKRPKATASAQPGVIDGEFTVVRESGPHAELERPAPATPQGRHG